MPVVENCYPCYGESGAKYIELRREYDKMVQQAAVLREALGWVKSPSRVNENTIATHCNGCEKLHSLEKSCKKALEGVNDE